MKVLRMTSAPVAAVLLAVACAHPAATRAADACRLAQAAARSGPAMRVPFELVDGRIYVQAKVNGRGPYRFAVDTGASGMGRADASLVEALGLPLSGHALNSDGVRTVSAATTRLDSLDLGGLVRRDLEVITRDYATGTPVEQRFQGIVGRGFFEDGLLVIDYPNRILAYSTVARIAPDARNSVGYERAFRIPVSIGGVRTTGHLDTGANVTLVLPGSLYEGIDASALQQAAKGTLGNGTIDTRRARVTGPVQIGGIRLVDLDVRVSDDFPELLVGAHVLQHHLLAIDQRTRRIALCERARRVRAE